MAATLAVFVGVQIVWANWFRPHLISPRVATSALTTNFSELLMDGNTHAMTVMDGFNGGGAWVLSNQTFTPANHVFTGPATNACLNGSQQSCNAWLLSKHLTQVVTFQPASRFWTFQWYEVALYVGLAALLAVFCAWQIRRRRLA